MNETIIEDKGPLGESHRVTKIKKLIEQEKLITTGDMILDSVGGRPLFSFVTEDSGVSSLCSPFGLVICEAVEFHQWCKSFARTEFLKNIDRTLRNKEMTLTGSPVVESREG